MLNEMTSILHFLCRLNMYFLLKFKMRTINHLKLLIHDFFNNQLTRSSNSKKEIPTISKQEIPLCQHRITTLNILKIKLQAIFRILKLPISADKFQRIPTMLQKACGKNHGFSGCQSPSRESSYSIFQSAS